MTNGESAVLFPIWAYGDGNLVRGSGLFIDKTGKYKVQVFCDSVEKKKDQLSIGIEITLDKNQTEKLNGTREIWFNWDEQKNKYLEKRK